MYRSVKTGLMDYDNFDETNLNTKLNLVSGRGTLNLVSGRATQNLVYFL